MHARSLQLPTTALLLALLAGCETALPEGQWDNPHDPDGSAFHPPILGLRDTAIRDGETGVVSSHARGQAAEVQSCRWTLDGEPLESRDCSIRTKGWADGNHVVTVSATDTRGVGSPPVAANVWIGNQPPRLVAIGDWRVGSSAEVWRDLVATDPDGAITSLAWDTVPDRYSIVSGSVHLDPLPGGGRRRVYWIARDDDGATSASSFEVGFVPVSKPEIRLNLGGSGHLIGSEWQWTVSIAETKVFTIDVMVDPSGFLDEPFTVAVRGGAGFLPCTQIQYYPGNPPWTFRCSEASVSTWTSSQIVATVTNRYGESSSNSIQVNLRRKSN